VKCIAWQWGQKAVSGPGAAECTWATVTCNTGTCQTLLPGKAFSGDKVVMVAAGGCHTVTVTSKGVLLAWGNNTNGQLGIARLEQLNIDPARVGTEDVFVGSLVRMMVGGNKHTLVVTGEEALWTCGGGENIMLSLNDINHLRVPTRVEAQHFGNAKIVSSAGGRYHSVVVTQHCGMYTWGKEICVEDASPTGLGQDNMHAKLVPNECPHLLQGTRVG